MYVVSSCLVGINCRYNGTGTAEPALIKLVEEGKAIAVCPEELAGLPTPREACEIIQGTETIQGVICNATI